MKQYVLISIMLLFGITATACTKKADPTVDQSAATGAQQMFSGAVVYTPKKQQTALHTRKMEKPALSAMENIEALQNGYTEQRTGIYTVTEDDVTMIASLQTNDPDGYTEYCNAFTFRSAETNEIIKEVPLDQIVEGATISLTDSYHGKPLTDKEEVPLVNEGVLSLLEQHGRALVDPDRDATDYENDGETYQFREERVKNVETIAGEEEVYKRYPQHTLMITSDLLLHVFHKMFSNDLQYFEQTIARKTMAVLAQDQFVYYVKKADEEQNTALQEYYRFLAAYRSIPYAIFIPEEEAFTAFEKTGQDITDEFMKELIRTRSIEFQNRVPGYEATIQKEIDYILAATESKVFDPLLLQFAPELYEEEPYVYQDFTQYVPRSHYTTNSLLKTYFMGMKFLMREKLYFKSEKLAKTSLLMANNLTGTRLEIYTTLQQKIQELIGQDDDISIELSQKFIADNGRTDDVSLIEGVTNDHISALRSLKPQNIISTSYVVALEKSMTEQQAHDATLGFVLFGEKTTIDSRIFDQLSAGNAEKEVANKPELVTAMSVPYIVADQPMALQMVELRGKKHREEERMDEAQFSGYLAYQEQMKDKVRYFDFTQTFYHQRLDALNYLFVRTDENAPYYLDDPRYVLKSLVTYMGSYTELKHDTLLYVKQAYAELGGGGGGDCERMIEPPALPIPKGYIEAPVELIDQLVALSTMADGHFANEQRGQFITLLKVYKAIAVGQLTNTAVDEAAYEALRRSYETLYAVTTPRKYIGITTIKEERGSLIADIFTSGMYGPLYQATGRPYVMFLMVDDIHGGRVVMGPVFTHYEFISAEVKGTELDSPTRLNDETRQGVYDSSTTKDAFRSDVFALPLP